MSRILMITEHDSDGDMAEPSGDVMALKETLESLGYECKSKGQLAFGDAFCLFFKGFPEGET